MQWQRTAYVSTDNNVIKARNIPNSAFKFNENKLFAA